MDFSNLITAKESSYKSWVVDEGGCMNYHSIRYDKSTGKSMSKLIDDLGVYVLRDPYIHAYDLP